jgi:hypothetical protein
MSTELASPEERPRIVALAARLAAHSGAARERARALARWDNEGGAPPHPGRGVRHGAKRNRFRP